MKRRCKKFLSFVLSLGMLIGSMSVSANAEGNQFSEGTTDKETSKAVANLANSTSQENQLAVYPDPPEGTAKWDAFSAQVKSPGGEYQDLYTYLARMANFDNRHNEAGNSNVKTGFVMFDFNGRVDLKITYHGGELRSAKVWPEEFGIEPTINGNEITFSVDKPQNIVLEINGNQYNALHIFANPMEEDVPSEGDENVMYFGPGLHEYGTDDRIQREYVTAHQSSRQVTQDYIEVPSGTTVYVAPGAVVKAQIRTNQYQTRYNDNVPTKENIVIRGRGVLDLSQWCGDFTNSARAYNPELPGIVIVHANDVIVEGLVVVNPERQSVNLHFSNNVTVDNVKGFTSMEEGDGIALVQDNHNITVQNCFVRTSDDSLVTGAYSDNIRWENNVVANMRVHSLMVNAAYLTNYIAKDIYIINSNAFPGLKGTIGVYGAGPGVEDITFENIYIERAQNGSMLEMYTYAMWTGGIGNIENVTFNNVHYSTKYNNEDYWSVIGATVIDGEFWLWPDGTQHDTNYRYKTYIDGVQFNNCTIDGKLITDSESGHISVGSSTTNVSFNEVPYDGELQCSPDIIPSAEEREGKYYRISSRTQSGKCLYDDGSGIVKLGEGTGLEYQWTIEQGENLLCFRNRATGGYLYYDASDGKAHVGSYAGAAAEWLPVGAEYAYFQLRNGANGQRHLCENGSIATVSVISDGSSTKDMWEFVEQSNYEAEEAQLAGGVKANTSAVAYSGTGIVSGYDVPGASVTFTVDTSAADIYNLNLKYANATGEEKTLSLYVNGTKVKQIKFPTLSDWNTWDMVTTKVYLKEGVNAIEYRYDENDSGDVWLDYIELTVPTKYEAEEAGLSGNLKVESDNSCSYISGFEAYGDAATFTVNNLNSFKCCYGIDVKYKNPTGEKKTLSLYINGIRTRILELSAADEWKVESVKAALQPGTNTISLVYDDLDNGQVMIDNIQLKRPSFNPELPSIKAYMLDGSPSLGRVASCMVDGDLSTYAQANTNALWKPLIDLGDVYNINSVDIRMDEWNYATAYDIQVSTDNVNWTTVATEKEVPVGGKITKFDMIPARYVKVNVTDVTGGGSTWGHAIYEIMINMMDTNAGEKVLNKIISPDAVKGLLNGTEKTAEALGLPETVKIMTNDGDCLDAAVIWDVDGAQYDPTVKTEQKFTVNGEVQLPADVANTYVIPLTASIEVTVAAAKPVGDKTLLQKFYEYALTLDTQGVTDSAVKFFEAAKEAAKAVLDDPNATPEMIKAAEDNLLEGIWGLGLVQGDKTMLGQLIVKAEAMIPNQDKYVQDNWQQLVDALAKAKEVMADGDAMESDVAPAAEALLDAILAQRYKADKSILEELIAKAKGVDTNLYTAESVAVFQTAMANAVRVLADEELSVEEQETVDMAAEKLAEAMKNLELVDTSSDTGDVPEASKPAGEEGDRPSESENNVQTGDNSHVFYVWVLCVAALCVGTVCIFRKKAHS